MPVVNIEARGNDKSPLADFSYQFNGGMVTNNLPSNLTETQFALGINTDIDQLGQVTTRRGSTSLGTAPNSTRIQGLTYYDTPSFEYLMQASNTRIYAYDNISWGSALVGYTGANNTLKVRFSQLIDKMYWVDSNTVAYRWDGTTVQASTAWGVATQPPTGCKFIKTHKNRIMIAGNPSAPQTLYPSDLLDPNFASTNQIEISKGDGDNITGLLSWIQNNFLVFKERSVWAVDTTLGVGSTATLQCLHNNIGCVSQDSICQIGSSEIGQDVFFMAKDGVRSLTTTIQNGQSGIQDAPLSYDINDWIQRINWSAQTNITSYYWNNRYFLSLPIDSATTPNYTFVFHTVNKSWSGYWTGWTPTAYAQSAFTGDLRLNFGQSDGKVRQWRDYVATNIEDEIDYQDDDVDYITYFKSKAYLFQSLAAYKRGFGFEVEFYNSRADVDIGFSLDASSTYNILTGFNSDTGSGVILPFLIPITFPLSGIARARGDLMQLGEFRELQCIVQSQAGKMAMKKVIMYAWVRIPNLRSSQ